MCPNFICVSKRSLLILDLPDEAALGCHIQDLYTKIVTGESPLQSTLGMIMLSAERFFSAEKDDAKVTNIHF